MTDDEFAHLPDELRQPCTTCGALAGKRCRSLTTHRTTDTHKARWLPQVQFRAAAIRAESPGEDPYGLVRRGETSPEPAPKEA